MSEVRHDPVRARFEILIDGSSAHLDYRMLSSSVIDFTHTYTPPELRGRGLASQLVEAGVAYARERGWQVVGSCSYVALWLERQKSA
jgi:hypothetical protein